MIAWLLALGPRALAHAAQLSLDGELPTEIRGCVSEAQLQATYPRALAAYGGHGAAALELRVTVASSAGAEPDTQLLSLTASAAGRDLGSRELQVRAQDCHALPEALALVLALLARDAAPAVSTSPQLMAAAQAVDTSEPRPKPAREPAPSERIALGAGAGAFFGVLPSAALSLQLQAATPGERLALRLKAGMLWPQEHALGEGSIRGRSYELSLEACSGLRLTGRPQLALRLCLGPRFGLMYARGRDFVVLNQQQREFLLYLGLLPEAALRLAGATWLQFSAGGAVAVVRPRFEVGLDGSQGVLQLKTPAVLRAELSLSLVQKLARGADMTSSMTSDSSNSLLAGAMTVPSTQASVPAGCTTAELFDAHAAFVLRLVRYLGVPTGDAEDVAQEVFVIAHQRLATLQRHESARSWLFGITRRMAANHVRKSKRQRAATTLPNAEQLAADSGDPCAQLQLARDRMLLAQALDKLDVDKRAVFVLFELEGMLMPEVAETVGCPLHTAYSRLYAARIVVQRHVQSPRNQIAQRRRTPP